MSSDFRRGRLQFTEPVEQWLADMRCVPQLRLEPSRRTSPPSLEARRSP
jgi:hypothetical protein